jgi:hypothetical protein
MIKQKFKHIILLGDLLVLYALNYFTNYELLHQLYIYKKNYSKCCSIPDNTYILLVSYRIRLGDCELNLMLYIL